MFTHAKTPVGKRPRPSTPSTPYSPAPTPYASYTNSTTSTPTPDVSGSLPSYVTQQASTNLYPNTSAIPPTPQRQLTSILPVTPVPARPELKLSHTTDRYSLDTYGPLPTTVKNAISRLAGNETSDIVNVITYFL